MGVIKELWQAEYEKIYDDLCDGMSVEEAKQCLKSLGFDDDEIDEHIHAWLS